MTKITELYQDGYLIGFRVEGHANYSIPGRDIVCAAVSMLTSNTVNTLSELAEINPFVMESDAYIEFAVANIGSVIVRTLLSAAKIGYRSIAERYPDNVMIMDEKRSINIV
ncbi:ribosomal-processing cysteine protease Prp [Clostridium sp. KNHs205]|uniref:ribosomal-processing cysteine protease Prp n=1 Tax=Clostridium sp. KNHs205 TaxID=1449050 RepID=UPI00051B8B18|nr:ribosomal-processing cysteine protease Prp [Clostridium sp. KNHs205]